MVIIIPHIQSHDSTAASSWLSCFIEEGEGPLTTKPTSQLVLQGTAQLGKFGR